MSLEITVEKDLLARFGKRWVSAQSLDSFKDVFVENTLSSFSLSGCFVGDGKEYACFIEYSGYLCGCIDNQIRKVICKHVLALTLLAFKKNMISEFELLALLGGDKKK